MSNQKEVMRAGLRSWRTTLAAKVVSGASEKVVENCIELIDWGSISSLYTYLPNDKQHELDTWLLLRYVWKAQLHVLTTAPVMNGDEMLICRIDGSTKIHTSKFGIPEPTQARQVKIHKPCAIIVPVMGYNADRYRLGYGYGHYDKFLAKVPKGTITVGFAYDESKREFMPEKHDVPLDYIVTEKGIL